MLRPKAATRKGAAYVDWPPARVRIRIRAGSDEKGCSWCRVAVYIQVWTLVTNRDYGEGGYGEADSYSSDENG